MTEMRPVSLKDWTLRALLIFCGLLTCSVLFLGVVSLWVGLTHQSRDGFWMPVLTGLLAIALASGLYYRLSRFVLGRIREEDILP